MKDTLSTGQRYWVGRTPIQAWPRIFPVSYTWSNATLHIQVDTSTTTDNPIEHTTEDGDLDNDATEHYKAHIVSIRNISDSIVRIGRTFEVFFMHLECRDKQGQWQSIQKRYEGCGTGQPEIYLKPGEVIITKINQLQGTFLTECRLAFGYDDNWVYSNVFKSPINETLFSIPEN